MPAAVAGVMPQVEEKMGVWKRSKSEVKRLWSVLSHEGGLREGLITLLFFGVIALVSMPAALVGAVGAVVFLKIRRIIEKKKLAELEEGNRGLQERVREAAESVAVMQKTNEGVVLERDRAREQRNEIVEGRAALVREREALAGVRERLEKELREAGENRTKLIEERNQAQEGWRKEIAGKNQLAGERDQAKGDVGALMGKVKALEEEKAAALRERDAARADAIAKIGGSAQLIAERNDALKKNTELCAELTKARTEKKIVPQEKVKMRSDMPVYKELRNVLGEIREFLKTGGKKTVADQKMEELLLLYQRQKEEHCKMLEESLEALPAEDPRRTSLGGIIRIERVETEYVKEINGILQLHSALGAAST